MIQSSYSILNFTGSHAFVSVHIRNAKIQKFNTNSYAFSTFRETPVILSGTDSPQIEKLLLWALLTVLRFFVFAQNTVMLKSKQKILYIHIYIHIRKIMSLNGCAWFMKSEFSCRLWQLRNKSRCSWRAPLPSGQTRPTPTLFAGPGMAGSAAAPVPMFLHALALPAALPSTGAGAPAAFPGSAAPQGPALHLPQGHPAACCPSGPCSCSTRTAPLPSTVSGSSPATAKNAT